MKTLKISSLIILFVAIAQISFGQTKSETLKVAGECGMCKKKIEKAAKEAGATYAVWNTQTKMLSVRYSSASTNSAKIQQKIADAGYDTPQFKATDDAYNKLEQCCQYDRDEMNTNTTAANEKSCCGKGDKCDDKGMKGSKGSKGSKDATEKKSQQ